jgi:branched-chain amino acid transport system substrate-binding protein
MSIKLALLQRTNEGAASVTGRASTIGILRVGVTTKLMQRYFGARVFGRRLLLATAVAAIVATIHDGSPYAQQLQQVFADNVVAMGGKVVAQEAVAPTDVDMHPVLTRIASAKPDLIYYPLFTAAAAQVSRQAKETPGLEKVKLMGGTSMLSADFIEAAGPSVIGLLFGNPDLSPDAMGKGYSKFVADYKKAYGEAPISGFHANAYDALTLTVKAIAKVAKSDKDGNLYIGRKAFRDAVFSTKFDGISGPIACDPYGECSQFKPSVLEFTSGDPKTFGIGQNPKKIWP